MAPVTDPAAESCVGVRERADEKLEIKKRHFFSSLSKHLTRTLSHYQTQSLPALLLNILLSHFLPYYAPVKKAGLSRVTVTETHTHTDLLISDH